MATQNVNASSNFLTGDDIESSLQIIDSNGGTGEWETGVYDDIERWQFPRFEGATDEADMYLSRAGIGSYESDVETIVGWIDAPRNVVGMILLLGEPGTGKTALVEAAATHAEKPLTTHIFTPDDTRESLMMRFVGEGNGDPGRNGEPTPFTLAPLPYAVKHGHLFYGDEFMLCQDGVKPIFYSLADGRKVLPGGNVDGTDIKVHPDFRMIVSSNKDVRGASLPEPIASRAAGTTLTVETSKGFLLDLGIDEAVIAAWESLKAQNLWTPQIRELRVADYWMSVDKAQAVSAFLPEHCPESQRGQVRDVVVGMLGGNVREDGRLVVS